MSYNKGAFAGSRTAAFWAAKGQLLGSNRVYLCFLNIIISQYVAATCIDAPGNVALFTPFTQTGGSN